MELTVLRYFLAAAAHEHLRRAAAELNVSPGAVSKSLARLEADLQTQLFEPVGRGLRLTPAGLALQQRAAHIIGLLDDTRHAINATAAEPLQITIVGEEVGLVLAQGLLLPTLQKIVPNAAVTLHHANEALALTLVQQRQAALALVTARVPVGLSSKPVRKLQFTTCMGPTHPLAGKRRIRIDELAKHDFVVPGTPMLGEVAHGADGWRDQRVPRRIRYRATSLATLHALVQSGRALAYLPDAYSKAAGFASLVVTDCPFHCRQTLRVICKAPNEFGWLARLWEQL